MATWSLTKLLHSAQEMGKGLHERWAVGKGRCVRGRRKRVVFGGSQGESKIRVRIRFTTLIRTEHIVTQRVPAEGVAVSAEKKMCESVNQKHSAGGFCRVIRKTAWQSGASGAETA